MALTPKGTPETKATTVQEKPKLPDQKLYSEPKFRAYAKKRESGKTLSITDINDQKRIIELQDEFRSIEQSAKSLKQELPGFLRKELKGVIDEKQLDPKKLETFYAFMEEQASEKGPEGIANYVKELKRYDALTREIAQRQQEISKVSEGKKIEDIDPASLAEEIQLLKDTMVDTSEMGWFSGKGKINKAKVRAKDQLKTKFGFDVMLEGDLRLAKERLRKAETLQKALSAYTEAKTQIDTSWNAVVVNDAFNDEVVQSVVIPAFQNEVGNVLKKKKNASAVDKQSAATKIRILEERNWGGILEDLPVGQQSVLEGLDQHLKAEMEKKIKKIEAKVKKEAQKKTSEDFMKLLAPLFDTLEIGTTKGKEAAVFIHTVIEDLKKATIVDDDMFVILDAVSYSLTQRIQKMK